MTTILTKKKDTAGAPVAGDLTNAAGGAELAVNTATKRLYTKDSGGNVVEVGTNPTATTMNGNLTFAPDATYDIGASGATRPRNLFLSGAATLGTALTVPNGGTGLTTLATGSLSYGAGTSAFSALAIGTANQILTVNSGATAPQWSTLTGVAVTTFSAGTTGFTPSTATSGAITLAGTLANTNGGTGQSSAFTQYGITYASTTTALATTAAGTSSTLLHGNASGAPTFGAVALGTEVSGQLPIANGGTGATTLAGANIPVTNVANTFTGLQTFAGTSSNADLKTSNILEVATISATAATGTVNYDVTTQSVLYYTTNASGNFTVNFRGSSGTSLDTVMSTGESLSATFLVTNGSTAYYNSAVTIDGTSVTPKWQGGTAPTSGNASSIDSYTYVVVKTGSATYVVLASQTKFA
jgi:hypothetical protein